MFQPPREGGEALEVMIFHLKWEHRQEQTTIYVYKCYVHLILPSIKGLENGPAKFKTIA